MRGMAGEIEDPLACQDGFVPSDSISFGRFEVESLSWERRSSFIHNRYLEEVEKYAKLGSVTQKKAYFEAHFKRKALRHLVAADCQNETEDKSSECGDPAHMNYMEDLEDLDDVQHAHFDEIPVGSDEDKLKADSYLHYFEVTHGKVDKEVAETLPAKSRTVNGTSDFMLDEEVQSEAAPPQIHHIEVESDSLLFVENNRDKEGEHVHLIKPQEVAELVETSDSSKDPMENVEACIISSKEMKKSSSKRESNISRTTTHSKMKQGLAANQNVSSNRSKVANGKPSREVTPRKIPEKVPKTSARENYSRKKTEFPTVSTSNRVESVKVVYSNCNSMKLHSSASDSERRCSTSGIPKEKTLPSRTSPKKKLPSRNTKTETTEFTKAKPNQDDRRYHQDKDVKDRKVRDVRQCTPIKGAMDGHMPENRPKLDPKANGIFSFKSDQRAEKRKEFYMKLEERLHAKEVELNQIQARNQEETEAEIKQFRRSLNFKATPMPTFYLGGAPKFTDAKKGPLTRSKSPSVKKKPTSSSVSSVSQENSTLQSALVAEPVVTSNMKPLDEKNCDKGCSDTARTTTRNEPEGEAQSYLPGRKTESCQKHKVRASHQHQQQQQRVQPKGDKAKSRTLKSGAKSINHAVSVRSRMVPLVADVVVAS